MPQQRAPIFRLPEELLLRIIKEYADQDLRPAGNHPVWYKSYYDRRWAILRTVKWDIILLNATYLWSFIELSWPKRMVDSHLSRRKSALLHISWNPRYDHLEDQSAPAWQNWIGENLPIIEELHLGVIGDKPSDHKQSSTNLLAACLTSSSQSLKCLGIKISTADLFRKTLSGHLPTLLTPNLVRLELSDCGCANLSLASLQSVDVVGSSASANEIFGLLSGNQALRSCIFHIHHLKDLPNSSLTDPQSSPLPLVHLRHLDIGPLPPDQLTWLFQRIKPEAVSSCSILLKMDIRTQSGFTLPSALHSYATRATILKVKDGDLIYSLPDQFEHLISIRTYHSTDSGVAQLNLFPSFTSLTHLYIEQYDQALGSRWLTALRSCIHLECLHIEGGIDFAGGLGGGQISFIPFLRALSEEAPSFCPKLLTLSLYDSHRRSWIGRQTSPWDKDDTKDKRMALDTMEMMLKVRAGLGIGIQKLILSFNTWWSEDVAKWEEYVGVVEVETDPAEEPEETEEQEQW
ncbi:hypothetical protein SISSUDRAFT_1125731 [Sistotremastrum suecicum HHB10207 ss-3]|uniref:F-box domain-containing protein n=1 Tax=Sistotremastrum suecicum HHB10207 ss-3 TaxID=1314776 RepID=A0A166H3I0_9AGAM|nr:hypothetical protein SISSUDRAFT_1125731 [Sistotremastrum suecicum HHB10207 ss-3]